MFTINKLHFRFTTHQYINYYKKVGKVFDFFGYIDHGTFDKKPSKCTLLYVVCYRKICCLMQVIRVESSQASNTSSII